METIIVPTDFSETADNAVNYAVELAAFFDAKLILVHAVPMPMINYDNVSVTMEMMGEFRQRSAEDLENLKIKCLQGRIANSL